MSVEEIDELVDQYGEQLYKFCCKLACTKEDADDLYQETFVKLVEGLHKIDRNNNPKSYLFSIPTLYYFFQSKEGIFKEILKQYYERFNTILTKESVYSTNTESYHDDVYPVLLRIANAYFAFARENKKFYMLILSLAFAPPTAQSAIMIEPYNIAQYKIIIQAFTEIAKTHGNLIGREQQCAYHFVALLNANIGFWYHGYGEINDQKARLIVHQFMHGIFA